MTELLKLSGVARELGISEDTARRYVKTGKLPAVFVGGSYRVKPEDIEEYLRQARVDPEAAAAQSASDARAAEAAGSRMVRLSAEGYTDLLERVSEGDAESLEAEAARIEAGYERALRSLGADDGFTRAGADALAATLAALALAKGGGLEDIQAAILRALAAHEQAHASVEAGA
jgi:excisionase family DNA binding protein